MKPEKALALSAPDFRLAGPASFRGYQALYLGDEFCENLLPPAEDLGLALETFKGRVTLVTPLLTDEVFDRVEALLRKFSAARRPLEVVVNDPGLLHALRKGAPPARISLGRLLGHRVKVMPPAFLRAFLKKHRVARVELDDPALLPRFEGFGLKVAFHAAFRYVSVSRFCPWERHWPGPCALPCVGRTRRLEHPRLPAPLLLRGQAYGIRGGKAPVHGAIDRVVSEPLPRSGR